MPGIPVCLTFKKVLIASVFGVGLFLVPNGVQAVISNSATLQWAPNQEADLGGYTVYHGTSPGIYSDSQDAGKTVTFRYAALESNKTHFFTVTAYDLSGNESLPSPEVNKTIIAPDSVLSVLVTGDGTVRSSPAGLSCSSGTCSGTFTQGSSVTLTATPGIGKIFSGWNGSCLGTGGCVVPISISSASVSATFTSSPSVSASLPSSPPPAWSLEDQEQLVQVQAQKQLAQVELQKTSAQKQLAQVELQKAREQKQLAQTPEERAKAQEQLAQAQAQKQLAQVELQKAKEKKQLAQAKVKEAKEQKQLAKIYRIQNALTAIETRLAMTNNPEVVARLTQKKERYSMVLARIQAKYSVN